MDQKGRGRAVRLGRSNVSTGNVSRRDRSAHNADTDTNSVQEPNEVSFKRMRLAPDTKEVVRWKETDVLGPSVLKIPHFASTCMVKWKERLVQGYPLPIVKRSLEVVPLLRGRNTLQALSLGLGLLRREHLHADVIPQSKDIEAFWVSGLVRLIENLLLSQELVKKELYSVLAPNAREGDVPEHSAKLLIGEVAERSGKAEELAKFRNQSNVSQEDAECKLPSVWLRRGTDSAFE